MIVILHRVLHTLDVCNIQCKLNAPHNENNAQLEREFVMDGILYIITCSKTLNGS